MICRRIAVLCGGTAAEADVSRSTAREVANALVERQQQVRLFELDATLPEALAAWQPELVFPALHGPQGEDGTVQGFLEILALPYVGSGVLGSATAMDKAIAKVLFESVGLPTVPGMAFDRWPSGHTPATLSETISAQLGPAIVVKPRAEGSALGVQRLRNTDGLPAALEQARQWPSGWLAERFVLGKEITVGVLDLAGQEARAMPPIEIITATDEWYDFNNRYTVGKSEHRLPATVSEPTLAVLEAHALKAHRVLKLRDLSRSDFLVTDDEELFLLETNTMPGMTPTSLYPDGAKALGYDFGDLMLALCESALRRYAGSSA